MRPVSSDAAASTDQMHRLKIDVSEQNGEDKVLADLPGMKKEDIRVSVDSDVVSISVETKNEKQVKEGERVVHSERYFGKYGRSFRLGEGVNETAAQAKYADGVLELVLPKKAALAARHLALQ